MLEGAAQVPAHAASRLHLALACLSIAAGGLLLGLQIDGSGDIAGTGYAVLGIGALVALVATLAQASASGHLPRSPLQAFATAASFAGLTFITAGVLAPGGAIMFFEVLLLIWFLARRRDKDQTGWPEVSRGGFVLIALMGIFRFWVTYQGSRHQWAVISVDVPLLSGIDADWIRPVSSVSLGSFTPMELGFPPTGIDFPLTLALWALGFVLCAAGLWIQARASREYESDRIHALISSLPPAIVAMVAKLLPEDEWEDLELFGLPERRLARRIETLVEERVTRQRLFQEAYSAGERTLSSLPEGFSGGIGRALIGYGEGPPADSSE